MRNWAENQIRLVLLRHGETKSNKEHRYLGRMDEALSKEGEKELLEYKRLQYYPQIDYLFTGPMKRCVQTAKILYPDREPVKISEWTEIDFGAFEGKNYMELKADKRYQDWMKSDGMLPFPEGESRTDFVERCEKGFQRMWEKLAQSERKKEETTIAAVVHGGTIMALLSRYYGGGYFDYQVQTGRGYLCLCRKQDDNLQITEQRKL